MKHIIRLVVGFFLLLQTTMAHAQTPTPIPDPPAAPSQAQTGFWSCVAPYDTADFTCGVTFQSNDGSTVSFGEAPLVTFTACVHFPGGGAQTRCLGPADISLVGTSKDGFTVHVANYLNIKSSGSDRTTVSGSWTAVGPALQHFTIQPQYMIASIVYAPPGSAAQNAKNSVQYSAGTTTGTTVSSSQSFKSDVGVGVEAGSLTAKVSANFDVTHSETDTQSLDIKKSVQGTLSDPADNVDGINHDNDKIYLLLRPRISVDVGKQDVYWGVPPQNADEIYLTIRQLKNPALITNSQQVQELANAGVDANEMLKIAAHDQFAVPGSIDPDRYVLTPYTFTYEPPDTATEPVPSQSYTISGTETQVSTHEVEDSVKVGFGVSAGPDTPVLTAKLSASASFTISNKNTDSKSTLKQNSAVLTVAGPSFGYQGKIHIQAYLDTVYNTYAFAFVDPIDTPFSSGILREKGKIVGRNHEVTLVHDGVRYKTWTDKKGRYAFYGLHDRLSADGLSAALKGAKAGQSVNLLKPYVGQR